MKIWTLSNLIFHSMNWDKVSISEIGKELISQIQQTKKTVMKNVYYDSRTAELDYNLGKLRRIF